MLLSPCSSQTHPETGMPTVPRPPGTLECSRAMGKAVLNHWCLLHTHFPWCSSAKPYPARPAWLFVPRKLECTGLLCHGNRALAQALSLASTSVPTTGGLSCHLHVLVYRGQCFAQEAPEPEARLKTNGQMDGTHRESQHHLVEVFVPHNSLLHCSEGILGAGWDRRKSG